MQPKPIPDPPVKPKRSEFETGKKGQPADDTAVQAYEKLKVSHEKAKTALKNSSADKKKLLTGLVAIQTFWRGFRTRQLSKCAKQ